MGYVLARVAFRLGAAAETVFSVPPPGVDRPARRRRAADRPWSRGVRPRWGRVREDFLLRSSGFGCAPWRFGKACAHYPDSSNSIGAIRKVSGLPKISLRISPVSVSLTSLP